MKWFITYLVANSPSQEKNKSHTIIVTDTREDRDWTYFTCDDGSTLGIPTHWIEKVEEVA